MAVMVTPSWRTSANPIVGSSMRPRTTSGVGAYASTGAASGIGNVTGGAVVVVAMVVVVVVVVWGGAVVVTTGAVAATLPGSSSVAIAQPPTARAAAASSATAPKRGSRRGVDVMARL